MTKAQIQALINQIDTTGNNGTTGQELKDIYEAFKNELFDYKEISIPFNDIQQLDTFGKNLLVEPLGANQEVQFYGIIKYNSGTTPFNEGEIVIHKNDFANGIRIQKSFLTGSDKIVYFSSENFIQDKILIDASTKPVLIPQNSGMGTLSLFSTDYFGNAGDGNMKVYLWWRIVELN